jgi:hypothetical protein
MLTKVFTSYLKEVDFCNNHELVKKVFQAFEYQFTLVEKAYDIQKIEAKGILHLPLHTLFAHFVTQFMLKNFNDRNQPFGDLLKQGIALEKVVASVLKKTVPDARVCFDRCLRTLVKQVSFVHEIFARRWVYHG